MNDAKIVIIKRPLRFYLLYLFTIEADLWCWVLVSLVRMIFGQRLHWIDGGLWSEIRKKTLFAKHFKYAGVTFGNGGLLRENGAGDLDTIDSPLEFHEARHVHQHQVMQVVGWLYTLFNYFVCDASLWTFVTVPFGFMIAYLSAMFVAVMRGEEWYRGNIFERSAYAQTKNWDNDD